jgi:hypothetical protein
MNIALMQPIKVCQHLLLAAGVWWLFKRWIDSARRRSFLNDDEQDHKL